MLYELHFYLMQFIFYQTIEFKGTVSIFGETHS